MRGQNKFTTNRARALRQTDNDSELAMWEELRGRRLNGFKFVRQYPIGKYFADFACRQQRLVLEIDGSQHANSAYDDARNKFMNNEGWSILRIWSGDVFANKESVLNTIVEILEGRQSKEIAALDAKYFPRSFSPPVGRRWPEGSDEGRL